MSGFNRRRFLQVAAAPLIIPRKLFAATQGDCKFIFLFCNGGWDPTWGFAPMYDSTAIDSNPNGTPSTVGDLSYVASTDAPSIPTYLTTYGSQTCVVNGFEVRSITHERCKRLLLTGKSTSDADDWPSQIAGHSSGYLLPHLVVSGPSYTSSYTADVVRLGETGQFARLLDGSALTEVDPVLAPLNTDAASAVESFRKARFASFAAAAGIGRAQTVGNALVGANDNLEEVMQITDLDLSGATEAGAGGLASLSPALDCLERGYARSVIMSYGGLFNRGWDTHSNIETQTANFECLFGDLITLMEDLASRSGPNGGTLADETCVVVISEMGRTPLINANGGKDHWTMTSAMFIGAGVAGGRVIGAYDDNLLGKAVDLSTGELSDSGTLMGSEHIGATILALADVEPEDEPISAVLA